MVDLARVAALLERIGSELRALRSSVERADDALLADADALPALKYRMVIAIEAATDVSDHMIASEGLRPAQSFADSFASLEEGGWLEHGLSLSMQDAAWFRGAGRLA